MPGISHIPYTCISIQSIKFYEKEILLMLGTHTCTVSQAPTDIQEKYKIAPTDIQEKYKIYVIKGTHTISNKIEIRPGTRVKPLDLILLVKPWNSIGNHTVQDYEFVRWSSVFYHVFVFTVKKRCVLFIYFIQ